MNIFIGVSLFEKQNCYYENHMGKIPVMFGLVWSCFMTYPPLQVIEYQIHFIHINSAISNNSV